MTEDEIRELKGLPTRPEITFLGQQFAIHPDGLAPLLHYAAATSAEASTYRLLEACIIDFPAFEDAAMTGCAQPSDIEDAAAQLIEFYCARNRWPAMRLLGFVAAEFDEVDGVLLKASGRGVASLSAREACNLALAMCLEGRNGDDRDVFLEDLNYEGNPEADALALVQEMKAARAAAAEANGARSSGDGGLGQQSPGPVLRGG